MASKTAWDEWFDVQYKITKEVETLIDNRLEGRSTQFKAAVISGVVENLSATLRLHIQLGDQDDDQSDTETNVASDTTSNEDWGPF